MFFSAQGRLRNGWWMLLFIALLVLTSFVYTPVSRGLQALGLDKGGLGLMPLPFLFALGATWACTRLRGERLSSVGFVLGRRWFGEFAAGTALGIGAMAATVALVWAIGGVTLALDPGRSLAVLGKGLVFFLFVALLEELLFRGFLFQRLVDGAGVWVAQLAFALLFAVVHWGNPGMEGSTQVWASIDIAIAAVMLGLAYLRTGSLALPVGLHLGWNWMQGHVLGFGVSGTEVSGWFLPSFTGKAQWLTGGEFGPEASVFAVIVDLGVVIALWRWKGTAPVPATTAVPAEPAPGAA